MITPMNESFKYFAFISYKREDEEWAVWLQHELEYYHLPASLNGREDLPKEFRPVFRDIDELKAGILPEQIHHALASSAHLIVICSPRSANSKWVNKEIEDFIEIGRQKGINNLERVFPFIVEGKRHDPEQECFPKYFRELPDEMEILGGNVNESGRDKAFVKIIAGMLPNISMDMLWNRYERDKAQEERKKREERDRLLTTQSRYIAEKALVLAKDDSYLARLMAIEALPKDLNQPDRPYIPEAEQALRVASYRHSAILRGHTSAVKSVSFSPDGTTIASSSRDKTVRLWNVKTGKELISLGHPKIVTSVAFSINGKFIMSTTSDETVYWWDIETGKRVTLTESFPKIYSNSSGPFNTSITPKGNTIRIIDNNTNYGTHRTIRNKGIYFAAISPDGKYIVIKSRDRYIHVWDSNTDTELQTLPGQFIKSPSSPFSPDGKRFATTTIKHTITIWDAEKRTELLTIKGNNHAVAAAFCPDQEHFAFATDDGVIHIWDTKSDKETLILRGRVKHVYSINYDPEGKLIVSACSDKAIHIWDTETGHESRVINGHNDAVVFAAFSHNGSQIVSSSLDNTIRVWDPFSGKELKSFVSQTDDVFSIAFDPDGRHFVSASRDHTVRVWDVETGKVLIELVGHNANVNSTIFSPDGKQIISSDNDGTIIIWPFPPLQELIDQTRERFKDRPLTTEERRMYYLE